MKHKINLVWPWGFVMYHNTHAECSTSFRKILTTPYPGTMVVHFLTEEAREKYELEKLWALGRHHDDQYWAMQRILEEQLTQ